MTKRLVLKNNINLKSREILYKKLDIVTYIRNMILIDIINETLLDDNKKYIINFISRSLLSINKDQNYNFSQFYQNFTERDFNKFYEGICELIQESNKTDNEKNLISLVNKSLKEFM